MKKKFTKKIDNIKIELKNKFGDEKFKKIYLFYKKEENVKIFLYNNFFIEFSK